MKNLKVFAVILGSVGVVFLYQNCAKDLDLTAYTDQSSQSGLPLVSSFEKTISIGTGDVATIAFSTSGHNLAYSWYKDESPLEGATQTPIYQVINAQLADSAVYRLCIANEMGTACDTVTLIVDDATPTPTPTPGAGPTPTPVPQTYKYVMFACQGSIASNCGNIPKLTSALLDMCTNEGPIPRIDGFNNPQLPTTCSPIGKCLYIRYSTGGYEIPGQVPFTTDIYYRCQ